ncbi:hypothetical protein QJS04_geneDACA002747 [Acorus gramineus]|uniref:Uncharacterized protein n=1 Tax=Acorus gramineus TaxID=55184 RepID=A0AAV9BWE6_ACOGR|nr:hypothetical protein QJS04_geneDACA002747 [Acorus gramineus]
MNTSASGHIRPLLPNPFQIPPSRQIRRLPSPNPTQKLPPFLLRSSKTQHTHHSKDPNRPTSTDDDDDVKTLARFRSKYNQIKVLEVSRRADHPLAGARLLLLDEPGNIHSITHPFKDLTFTYFDVFATLPPLLPPGPIGILGFGAGSAARSVLRLFPASEIHGWEIDPCVVSVGREFFGLSSLEERNKGNLFIHIGDALKANVNGGLSGVLVDLFFEGSLVPELQRAETWERLKGGIREGGRVMVNCGGVCVESEDPAREGGLVMEETLRVMGRVFGEELLVLNMGWGMEDSCLALTGGRPDEEAWKRALPDSLGHYVDLWRPFHG